MLFNIYMRPLGGVIRGCGASCHQYADDTQLYISFSPTASDAVLSLQRCLGAVLQWMQENGLRLNPDKTEVLRVGGPVDGGLGNSLMYWGVALAAKSGVRSLGVHLDPTLTMETQVASVVRSAFFHLWRIARLRPYLDTGTLTTLVHALVISRLDYCNALYVGLPLKVMRKLQVVQNAAARLLTGVRKCQHISPTLAMLHWLPIRFRIDFKVLMLTYKALNGLGPRYLMERLLPPRSTRITCMSQEVRLRSLTTREARKERTRNRAFSAVAPRLWNNLPPEIRAAPTLDTFKSQLKTWLYIQAFPPVNI
uniref:Reverse transcriptase domain-containing protein n=1 Tax=Pogona vitticeps TaxID=103695 RepID=A0ABM5FTP4_9SAUR